MLIQFDFRNYVEGCVIIPVLIEDKWSLCVELNNIHNQKAVKFHVEFYSFLAYNIYKRRNYIKERKLILCRIYYLYQI